MKKKTKSLPEQEKFKAAIDALDHALEFEKEAAEDRFFLSGIMKSFESCIEYAWKYFKRRGIEEGIEIYSPKEAIKIAGRLKIIDDVEKWLEFLEDRNLAVHDYLGISDETYLKSIKKFLAEAKKLNI